MPAAPASPRRRSRALLAAIVAVTTASTGFAIQNAASAERSSASSNLHGDRRVQV
jgi:hypothetical protein